MSYTMTKLRGVTVDLYDFYQDSPTRLKTRKRIIESGIELFSEHGMEAVTMQNVASNCDITTRNLYRYYPNKEFLVVDIAFQVLGKISFHDLMPEDEHKMSGVALVEHLLRRMRDLENNVENGVRTMKFIMYFDLFMDMLDKGHPAYQLYTEKYVKHIQDSGTKQLEYAIKKGVKDGSIQVDIQRISVLIEYMIQSLIAINQRALIKEKENKAINQELVDEHIKVLINYIKAKE